MTAIFDSKGKYVAPMLTWDIVTEALEHERATQRLNAMVDQMPINVMMCDKDSFEITYVNKTSITTLGPLEGGLAAADQLLAPLPLSLGGRVVTERAHREVVEHLVPLAVVLAVLLEVGDGLLEAAAADLLVDTVAVLQGEPAGATGREDKQYDSAGRGPAEDHRFPALPLTARRHPARRPS